MNGRSERLAAFVRETADELKRGLHFCNSTGSVVQRISQAVVLTRCQVGIAEFRMPTVTVKISDALHRQLADEERRRRTSKSAVLREAFSKQAGATKGTLAEKARHLIGSINGPGDLSRKSKSLAGYGRSRSR